MSDLGVKIVKVLNAGSAIVLAFAGFWIAISQLINGHFTIASFFGPFFFVFFGFLLVANEIKFGHVLNEYGFLKTFLGRGLFYIFLSGVVCYGYYSIADNYVAGNIYGTVFFILGVFYLLMNFYPKGSLGNLSRVLYIFTQLVVTDSMNNHQTYLNYKNINIVQIIYAIPQK
ncbi:unnamed protein product [Paramecium octaurelia]|uniref:COPI associated protein n=1 Tax=Paramecium octaurelia TaxID=43137 RepID=A0A8S1W0B3_PAROT|nr:unnamed protein product [Paramecium octaurelia]